MNTYTITHIAFLTRTFRQVNATETAARFNERFGFNHTPTQMKRTLRHLGIRSGRPAGRPTKEQAA